MLRRVALVRTDVSEEHRFHYQSDKIRRGRNTVVTSNGRTLRRNAPMMEEIRSSETPVFSRATWYNIQEDGILHSHHRGNLKPYKNQSVLDALLLISNDHCA
jgi:hypothetical protein